ncbi:hypothetical protein [Devosia sp. RR2S18]|uniref:hypothetical protein n=1 Tax=Devosia rhizosphaerae TaxID=3049774 RepID=UPI0025419A05|nr:hypothetical protein [Devosia sp. RR2S18]WIJ24898.1 hypothetical protein QOV41_18100 [Devosia sp. RR2S18]
MSRDRVSATLFDGHSRAIAGRLATAIPILAMPARTRDTLALFTLASLAILVVLYADVNAGDIFLALLDRF